MAVYETHLKVRKPTPFTEMVEKLPSVRTYCWCNLDHDIVEVTADDPEEFKLILGHYSRTHRVLEESDVANNAVLITTECTCSTDNSVHMNIGELEILSLMPIVTAKGYNHFRLIAFRHEALTELISRLKKRGFEIEITKKQAFSGYGSDTLITLNSLVANITDKQLNAVISAHNNGYYNSPRSATVQQIADRLDVPRTTLQEHLMKAENKLLRALIPYIQLHRPRI